MKAMAKWVGLARIRPGEEPEVWYMRRTGDTPGDVKMERGEAYLAYFRAMLSGQEGAEIPAEFDTEEEAARPVPSIYNACISPDGKYALVYARFTGVPDGTGDRLYMLRLGTMEARPVEVPDGKLGLKLAAGSSFGRRYEPCIVWHPDGTVVMLTEDDGIGFFTLAVR